MRSKSDANVAFTYVYIRVLFCANAVSLTTCACKLVCWVVGCCSCTDTKNYRKSKMGRREWGVGMVGEKEHWKEGCRSAEEGDVWGGEEADLILHQLFHLA